MDKPIVWSYWNHEPIYHLKRMGNDGGSIFSIGEWVDEWYDRLHTEELIKKGADLGINTIYTHFYKGSGLVFEKEEMDRTKELTKIAHKYGIKVLGYMSMGSIYTENITKELPDVEEMLVVDMNGRYAPTLGNQYYRPRPCYNSDKYLEYLKSVIKYGIEEVGLDGFHFDNSSMSFCYCENCQRKFKEFLKENFKNPYEIMGIKDFDNVKIPCYDEPNYAGDIHEICPKGNIHDVLFMWYYKFLRNTVADFHKNCFDYVKEVSEGKAKVLHNPGFPRAGVIVDATRQSRTIGYDPESTPESCDYVFVENRGGYFGKKYGRVCGQTLAYKHGERFGYKVFDTSWAIENGKLHQFPSKKSVVLGNIMEAAVYGGIAGSPWTVRTMGEGDEVAIDTPYLRDALKDSFEYFTENYSIFNSRSYNHVKVLFNYNNYVCAEGAIDEVFNVPNILTENGVRYSIITEDDIKNSKEGDTIILPKILYCKESMYRDLKEASEKGVKIIATEGFGHYNEYTKARSRKNEILNLQGIDGAIITTKEELVGHIDKKIFVDVPDVLVETRITEDNKLVLHVLNADAERNLEKTEVVFSDEILKGKKTAKVYTPDSDTTAEVEISDDKATVKINNYGTLVSVVFEG